MKLPNADKVIISKRKITNYILSETHQQGWGKAKFFIKYGFEIANYMEFTNVLKRMAKVEKVKKIIKTKHGVKYVLEGKIKTPTGIKIKVRTVWIIEKGNTVPRLVTSYSL